MKHIIPVIVTLLLLSTSFVGVGNQVEEQVLFKEKKIQTTEKFFDESKDFLWSMLQGNFWSASNYPYCKSKNNNNFNNFNIQGEFPDCDHYAYIGGWAYGPSDCWIYKFKLSGGDSSCVCYGPGYSTNFISSGTWTSDQRLLVVGYSDGTLYEVDLDNCELIEIGGGGVGLNGLTFDPTDQQLYGCSSHNLYKIDSETGEQELIGPFTTDQVIVEIACDADGVMYGWDVKYSGNSILYTINKETGETTPIGSMGMTLLYAQDGDFCRECDILYLAPSIYSPYYSVFLVECDEDTGECEILGDFGMDSECFFVIPDDNELPIAEFNWTPQIPQPGQEIIFNASESYDPDGYIKLYEWDWDNDGVYDEKNYTSPIATHGFENAGFYQVTLCVHDNCFATNEKTITIKVGNLAPSTPEIDGKKIFKVGESGVYTYTFYSTDPDYDEIRYGIDWGDNDTQWTPFYPSGEKVSIDICINADEKGTYQICRIKAVDEFGADSNWSTLEITVPKSHYFNIWNGLLDRFPLLKRLLEGFIR